MGKIGKAMCYLCVTDLPTLNNGRIDDGTYFKSPHFIGNSILLYGERTSRFPYQAIVGPDWFCMTITYLLILVPTFFFLMDVGAAVGPWVIVIGSITFLAAIISYSLTACSDPGIIFELKESEMTELNKAEQGGSGGGNDGNGSSESGSDTGSTDLPRVPPAIKIECGTCKIKRPRTAAHCYECGVCVDELDHHCPWTGKCIGKRNLHFFWAFLFTISVHIAFVAAVSLWAGFTGYKIFRIPA